MSEKSHFRLTQEGLVREYFQKHPLEDVKHQDSVDWLLVEWEKRTGTKFRDPDRAIRKLYARGFLNKVDKGVYRYDPQNNQEKPLTDFTNKQKEEILKRGCYRCAICGKTRKNGVELHIDHMKPRSKGGKSDINNGQVLCAQHNFRKKYFDQTETGKRMFINLEQCLRKNKDEKLTLFVKDILKIYEKHGINGHIAWKEHTSEKK